MICDTMDRLVLYRGINHNLDFLIEDLLACKEIKEYPEGKKIIDDKRAWISRGTVVLIEKKDLYEKHDEYGDVHIVLDGSEQISYLPSAFVDWSVEEGETHLAAGPDGTTLILEPGMFVIFFPWDAHRPGVGYGTCDKLVGKFLYDEQEK